MTIDCILPLTQNELFSCLAKFFKRQKNQKVFAVKKSYILVEGNAPIMLVAHLDTVHKTPVQTICRSEDGNILMSPEGIGGDDRCGVYALLEVYRKAETKPWLLFTCDEEIGGYGAEHFCKDFRDNQFPNELKAIKLIVEIDRKGSQDAVYYDCDCPELEAYIATKGFQTDFGTFSDICLISPTMGIASVNLSSGYYNAHTLHEYILSPKCQKSSANLLPTHSLSTSTKNANEISSLAFPMSHGVNGITICLSIPTGLRMKYHTIYLSNRHKNMKCYWTSIWKKTWNIFA